MKPTSVFKCFKCNETFCSKFRFFEHKSIHSKEMPFMCLNCRKSFNSIDQYVSHFNCVQNFIALAVELSEIDNSNPDFETNGCQIDLDSIFNLLTERNKTINCLMCSKVFHCSKSFLTHFSRSTINQMKNFLCSCCKCVINLSSSKVSKNFTSLNYNKKFNAKDEFKKRNCSSVSMLENFQCSCTQIFNKVSNFKDHVGKKPFRCCACSMQFNTITNLIRHIRTHTKQKPYVCADCGRSFSQSAHLKNHSSVHLGTNAMKCDKCDFSCKTVNGLLKHKKKHKEDIFNHETYIDGRKKSKDLSFCPICNKQFLFKRNMGMHMKIHSNEASLCTECGKVFDSKGKLTSHYKACHREPSVCKTCGKVFASAVLLGAHQKTHVLDKIFPCEVCNKTFSIKNYLVQHMKTHSNKKQYSCSKCGKLFKVAVSLKYHRNICTSLNILV